MASAVVALAAAGSAAAFQALPPGGQVNDDLAAGIDRTLGVNGDNPTNADVVGGALVAGKPNVPWAVLRAHTTGHDQIFSRSFANGVWTTRGNGTVGGRSLSSHAFSGSLNFDQGQDGEAPAIDFAGTGRTVPWATWYENTQGAQFGQNNIFASRFDDSQGKWVFGGQGRGLQTVTDTAPVPSLNIHTNQDAENPSVAGGSAVDPTKPGPWVTWQETGASAPGLGNDQIFVSKPVGPGTANCDGIKPLGVADGSGHVPAIGGFCWNQVGIDRLGADPSLNVDRGRNAVEPDIAFTGNNDGVPWVVWYEKDTPSTGLAGNEMVFAARGIVPNPAITPAPDGGFEWQVVGTQATGVLDNSTAGSTCAASATAEGLCSLNKDASKDAEDPRVAAGTMNPANATAPWVTWDEKDASGVNQVVVARLVTAPTPHFEIVNNGAPISIGANPSTRPDITFSGNTPYVSWREDIGGGVEKGFYGHFVNAANPTFVLDESDVPLAPTTQADVREPISSSCTANPFNQDGKACQGTAIGTPFFLFTNDVSGSTLGLFGDAYVPGTPTTGAASSITQTTANVAGSVNPQGAAVRVSFQYGTTTAYGQSTTPQTLGPDNSVDSFSDQLTGLTANTVVHYRAIAVSDFGTVVGTDQTLTTQSAPPPPPPPPAPPGDGHVSAGRASISGTTASIPLRCTGQSGANCHLVVKLTVIETLKGHKVIAVTAAKTTRKTVTVGSTTVTLIAGQRKIVKVSLNHTGRVLLRARHALKVRLLVTETLANGNSVRVTNQVLTFRTKKH